MSLQQVYRLTARSSFRDLALFEEEVPSPDKHEVLIKVRSVALNYRDLAIASSQYPFPVKENVVPLSDAVGEVIERGSAVRGLETGDVVLGSFDPTVLYGPQMTWNHGQGGPVDGVLRQYIVLPANAVVKVPSLGGLSFAQWATLPCTGVTAWNALYGNIPLRPGQTVLFQGMQYQPI
jgi:NADPH:quinone reductase-like Zn-dependent oxidoreductase